MKSTMLESDLTKRSRASAQGWGGGVVRLFLKLAWLILFLPVPAFAWQVPVLVYHRFGPEVTDSMMVRTAAFESQLCQIEAGGYTVIPLRRVVDALAGRAPPPPPGSVAVTADDGHRSVYTEMWPILRRHPVPVTLFIYPSAISNARYAMTWDQLAELRVGGLFDIQSHSYWHPNFMRERKRLDPVAYARLVDTQLTRSRQVLEARLGGRVDLLAWPFGLQDEDLRRRAAQLGYVAGFTLERRPVRAGDDPMALPRYLITDAVSDKAFAAILRQAGTPGAKP